MNRRQISDPCRLAAALLALGCAPPSDGTSGVGPLPEAAPAYRAPVTGKVTYNGEPLAGAAMVFLPTDQLGSLGHAETDSNGNYRVVNAGWPGIAPGHYKISISYQVTASGKLVTLSMHNSTTRPYEVMIAKEQIPLKYSDLGRTELEVKVPPEGLAGLNFDLEGPPLVKPIPQPAPSDESAAPMP